jgi:hypothetical protein
MARMRSTLTLAFAALTTLLAACGESGPAGTTSLSIKLKDAPGDLHTAVVTIEAVELVGSGGVTVLSTGATTVDLLTLASQTADLVTDAVVASGSYSQLRFRISGGYIEVENADGSTSIYASSPTYAGLPAGAPVAGTLQMPSFAQSGLKVTMADGALEILGDQKVLLVDFDVQQSFGHGAGQSGGWAMHPVITGGEIGVSAGVRATVRLAPGVVGALADVSAALTDANDVAVGSAPLTDADADGVFEASFSFLAPGTYHLSLTPPAGVSLVTDPVTPFELTLTSGQQLTAALTVTAVQ